jgi:hypothetical protein
VAAPTQAPVTEDSERSTILAEMASGAGPAKAAPADAEPEKAAEPAVEAAEVPRDDEPAAAEPEAEAEAEAAPAPAPEKKAPPADPEGDRRLAQIAKAEKANKLERQAAAKDRAEAEAARKETAEAAREMAAFKAALARVKYDPVGVLESLGYPADRFEDAATAAFARSEKGKADPRYKEQSERAMREREQRDGIEELRAELKELKTAQAQREQAAASERAAERYMADVSKAARAATDAPLLKALIAKNPEKADRQLASIALSLFEETGDQPDHADIIVTFEKRRREELEDLGIDVASVLKPTTTPKPKDKTAGEKPSARTLSNDHNASTKVPRSDLSEQEEREQILAEIAKMNRGSDADARPG